MEGFDLETELPGEERSELRAWARTAIRPYTTLLEAVRAIIDPGDCVVQEAAAPLARLA